MAHIKTKIYAVDLLRRFDRFYGCWLNINIYSERTERGAHASVSEYYSHGTYLIRISDETVSQTIVCSVTKNETFL